MSKTFENKARLKLRNKGNILLLKEMFKIFFNIFIK